MLDRRSILKMAAGGALLSLVPASTLQAKTLGKRYAMVFDVRRCTGCLSCTVSCSVENQTEAGRCRTRVNQASLSLGERIATLAVPNQCNQCDNPVCTQVCPVEATYKRKEDGIVVIDHEECIHCQLCVDACPYGARRKDESLDNPPEKCNFCIHRVTQGLLPACVETCIGGARTFGDLNDPDSQVSKLVRDNKVYAMLSEAGTSPNIFYIGLPTSTDDQAILNLNYLDWQR
ncbi:4Fe-4S dicluster domain-containing protein [Shewanella insulae]|uniref:4Fe-4S dicluster domain-containing protein n=1 Tax=Shewanella insulae TaxID=2681496 RepID=A0A6L7I2A9_9GAMM|nr:MULTISPECIES: 4Fe-4S dicluster domain-containing protein [Shewanella]MCG9714737.1 4Fe-4S dicluster domain-containing protein [Shewanella insulae]MCG9740120.1 4Fe-4S dicluster domain-containing protein [Shewanella insulae]MCG9756942.1 4Fe-4S dicluster domain-containing protein [Shewanella insulae]MCL2911698.1 4Fe-4S dicluster domain-containing protein [Shewanella aquimarina]MXR70709.1 4Fe-4S dicluster domain-containing protein [Shewanella insulae]